MIHFKKVFLISVLVTMACTSSAPPQQQPQVSQKANDEEKTGNGGNVVNCTGQNPVVLDFYNATIPTLGAPAPTLVDISQYTVDQVVDFFKSRFASFPYFEPQFEDALKTIGSMDTWLSANLKNTRDANETYHLPQGCSLEQAAVRQGTTMYGDPNIVNSLSPAQQGILLVHEALYYIGDTASGLRTSEKIRSVIREVLKTNFSKVALGATLYKIGGLVSPFQTVLKNGATFTNRKDPNHNLMLQVSSPYTAGFTVSIWDNGAYAGSGRYGIAKDILWNEEAKYDVSDVQRCAASPRPWPDKGPNSTITDTFSISLNGDTSTWTMLLNDCSNGNCIQTTKSKVFHIEN